MLGITSLSGLGASSANNAPDLRYHDIVGRDTNDTNTCTLGSMSIGPTDTDRFLIILGGYRRQNSHNARCNSMTFGGGATTLETNYDPSALTCLAICRVLNTGDTTGNVNLDIQGAGNTSARSAAATFSLRGMGGTWPTVTTFTANSSGKLTASPSYPAGSSIAAVCMSVGATNASFTWDAGMTAQAEATADGDQMLGAALAVGAPSGLTIGCTPSLSSGHNIMIGICIHPAT